jgi:shikimate kinase
LPEPASSIVLVGMMAAGKTSVGRRLAERRGWEFFDSDRQVEAMTGRTVGEIWRTDGEPAFRALEAQVLADALASSTPRVIAAAGGTVLDPRNRRLIEQHHPVVWLRARPGTLVGRLGAATHRPLLDVDPAGALEHLDAERRPHYEEVADVAVDVDDLTADQVAAGIEAALDHGPPRPGAGTEHG